MYSKLIFFMLCISLFSCQSTATNERMAKQKAVLEKNIGEPFRLENIVDTSGQNITLDFSKADINIIDFCNNRCPPCIEEMKQFPALIENKPQVKIYSISLSQFWIWKPTMTEHTEIFSFLQNDVPNWKQYNLKTADNPRFKNEISSDRLAELDTMYGIMFNPAYMVVDKTGKIIARPQSAVEYLKNL